MSLGDLGIPLYVFSGVLASALLVALACGIKKIVDRSKKKKNAKAGKMAKPVPEKTFTRPVRSQTTSVATTSVAKSVPEVRTPLSTEEDEIRLRPLKAMLALCQTPYDDWHVQWASRAGTYVPSAELCKIGMKKENRKKCRFNSNRMCLDKTRVVLLGDARRFMDANWMDEDRSLICASAPLGRGVPDKEDTRAEFYSMLITVGVANIVMACQMDEIASRNDKHFADLIYFPYHILGQVYKLKDGSFYHVLCTPTGKSQVGLEKHHLDITFYDSHGKETKHHKVTHFYLNSWLKNALCTDIHSICDVLCELVDQKHVTFIHCSDGQGRAGSFALMLMVLRDALIGEPVDPINTAIQLRKCRYKSIASPTQFTFALYCVMMTLMRYILKPPMHVFHYMSEFSILLMRRFAEGERASERRRVQEEGKEKKHQVEGTQPTNSHKNKTANEIMTTQTSSTRKATKESTTTSKLQTTRSVDHSKETV